MTVTLIVICLAMARLQLWRADIRGAAFDALQKAETEAPVSLNSPLPDAIALQLHRVQGRGTWLAKHSIFLDNKVQGGKVGYQVLTPLQLQGQSAVVLVNRGWVAAPRLRSELPAVRTPGGLVAVMGVARKFDDKVFELSHAEPEGQVWQHVREQDYRAHSGLNILPFIVLQDASGGKGETADGLVRDWQPATGNPAPRHVGYAIMWGFFSLIAATHGVLAWRRA